MASGVGVIAAPDGGMKEMIEHGINGWIAASQRPAELASATREALARGPHGLATVGARAASTIRQMCNEQHVVSQQLVVAARMVRTGARSTGVPGSVASAPGGAQDADQAVMARMAAVGAPWSVNPAGVGGRVLTLGTTLRRAASQPIRSARMVVRHLRWRVLGTPP